VTGVAMETVVPKVLLLRKGRASEPEKTVFINLSYRKACRYFTKHEKSRSFFDFVISPFAGRVFVTAEFSSLVEM